MIVITGSMPIKEGAAEGFSAAAATLVAATLAEEGCLDYSFAISVTDPTVVRIAEAWTDDDALSAHLTQPHMAAFGQAVAEFVAGAPDLTRFDTDEGKPLFG